MKIILIISLLLLLLWIEKIFLDIALHLTFLYLCYFSRHIVGICALFQTSFTVAEFVNQCNSNIFAYLQSKLAYERLPVNKVFHPFVCGPNNATIKQLTEETGAKINVPPPSVNSDEIVVSGEKDGVMKCKSTIMAIYEEKVRNSCCKKYCYAHNNSTNIFFTDKWIILAFSMFEFYAYSKERFKEYNPFLQLNQLLYPFKLSLVSC